jgi:hypothetical protein
MIHSAKYRHRVAAKRQEHPFLPWHMRLGKSIRKGLTVLKRELKIPSPQELRSLKHRADVLERRISYLRTR